MIARAPEPTPARPRRMGGLTAMLGGALRELGRWLVEDRRVLLGAALRRPPGGRPNDPTGHDALGPIGRDVQVAVALRVAEDVHWVIAALDRLHAVREQLAVE